MLGGTKADAPPTVALFVSRRLGYLAQNAAFGGQVTEYMNVNAMYPPSDEGSLCQYPDSLTNLTEADRSNINVVNAPIAFVVGYDEDCAPYHQAIVAHQIQKNVTSKLKFLIVHGKDPEDNNELKILHPEEGSFVNLDSLIVLYVNYRTGLDLQRQMAFRQDWWDSDPYFLDPQNIGWSFYFRVGPYESTQPRTGSDSFYWFRIVLFTLLIVSPCCRACYLWYAAGGRFQLRRNENGWISGISYVAPTRHWLTNGIIPGRLEPVSNTLSEEKFNELPEITYVPGPKDENDEDDEFVEASMGAGEQPQVAEDDQPDIEKANLKKNDESSDEEGDAVTSKETVVEESKDVSKADVEPKKAEVSYDPSASAPATCKEDESGISETKADLPSTTTTCTMCSICIDDFEPGERLVLLPRCQHAFHKDCIHPWLTERQGCCPLCKTNVCEEDDNQNVASTEDAANSDAGDSATPTDGQASNATVPESTVPSENGEDTSTQQQQTTNEDAPTQR